MTEPITFSYQLKQLDTRHYQINRTLVCLGWEIIPSQNKYHEPMQNQTSQYDF
jgi:hypothetical protein